MFWILSINRSAHVIPVCVYFSIIKCKYLNSLAREILPSQEIIPPPDSSKRGALFQGSSVLADLLCKFKIAKFLKQKFALFSEPVRKCLRALEAAETDTEKFATLFLVPKLVRGSDCDRTARLYLMKVLSEHGPFFVYFESLLFG
jgi:hypothetical protein